MWLCVFLPLSTAFCYNCSSDTISPCRCDADCVLFNDCCPLANATVDSEPTLNNKDIQQCQPVVVSGIVTSVNQAYYMISTCHQEIPDRISKMCEQFDIFAPVTDNSTGLTYRNLYCALCHNVPVHKLAMWLVNFQCGHNLRVDDSLTLDHLQAHCHLYSFVPQPQLVQHTRWCLPSTSQCSINNSEFQNNCTKGQLDPVIAVGKVYRNFFCAKCSLKDIQNIDISCHQLLEGIVIICNTCYFM